MKKRIPLTILLLTFALLAGCGKKEPVSTKPATTKASTIEKTTTTTSSNPHKEKTETTTTKEKPKEKDTLWNATKKKALATFMKQFSQNMNQQYQNFYPGHNTDLYGLNLPDFILNHERGWQMAVDENPVSLSWSKDGSGTADYNLVDVYSDAETQDYLEKHVYFFTIHQGKPVVLITQQNQANPNNFLYFSVTQNQELSQAFSDIVING